MTVYDFSAKTITGEEKSLKDYKGKALLIVNVASKCGFTPQYKGLQEVYDKYKDQGLEILGFPCNQFGGQEPGTEADITSFCELNY
ncbi:MAG TPA: glutathione peroxidase, partial [Bacillus sp. (in: Bacteria)]|nr:glutathione peroxidase [Bacillus sp. (in: firmicutes)]